MGGRGRGVQKKKGWGQREKYVDRRRKGRCEAGKMGCEAEEEMG